jgi:integrase
VLPPARKVAPVAHHAAMDYRQLPQFMAELRHQDGTAARALEFLILTAARTGEVTGATWDEIDSNTWIIRAHRIKAGREHRVPLSPACIDLLHKLPRQTGNPFVFVGPRPGSGLSSKSMTYASWGVSVRPARLPSTVLGPRFPIFATSERRTAPTPSRSAWRIAKSSNRMRVRLPIFTRPSLPVLISLKSVVLPRPVARDASRMVKVNSGAGFD